MNQFIPSNYLCATETLDLIRSGRLTVEQLARDHLTRYHARDAAVHAWAYIDEERILAEARRLDAIPEDQRGPLHGVIVGVKDMIDTKDMPTEHGSRAWVGNRPGADATAVAIARAAGALIYAKAHTVEFAMGTTGTVVTNPYDANRTPGGSSSGSAAAVRDYQCQISFGTQTGGSMIRPGSYNGIFAIKPTWGSISKEGVKMCSLTLDTIGFYARSLSDLDLLLRVYDINDDIPPSPSQPKPLSQCRFLYLQTPSWAKTTPAPELLRAWDHSRELLVAAGAEVVDGELGAEFEGLVGPGSAQKTIVALDSYINLTYERHQSHRLDLLVDDTKDLATNASGTTRRQLLDAYDKFAALRPVMDKLASQYDAIVTPSVPSQAPVGLKWTGDFIFNGMWTGLHVPVVHIPGWASEQGLPIGLSLVAPRYEDQRLLNVAKSVASVWMNAEQDKLKTLHVPDGVVNLQI